MSAHSTGRLDELVAGVLAATRYSQVSPELVRSLGSQELAKRRNVKEAIKSTKNKLHQVAGVYLPARTDYAGWLDELSKAAEAGGGESIRSACRRIMERHASTRERLSILDQFYAITLAGLGPIHRVVDVACGLNPLALPWMPLAEDAEYYAYDIYLDMMAFISSYFASPAITVGHRLLTGHGEVLDVVKNVPEQPADLALILKAIPCLEQMDKYAGARLLHQVPASHVLVSFPARSLAGRSKGMLVNYEARFHELVAGTGWPVKRFEFATELAFLISK